MFALPGAPPTFSFLVTQPPFGKNKSKVPITMRSLRVREVGGRKVVEAHTKPGMISRTGMKAWKDAVGDQILAERSLRKIRGLCAVCITHGRSGFDRDAHVAALLDVLQHGGAYDNDSAVDSFLVRHDPALAPRTVRLDVWELCGAG
jgi:Holliday junction resolvase RusA-like endonuclease